jgi:hypothetical protein
MIIGQLATNIWRRIRPFVCEPLHFYTFLLVVVGLLQAAILIRADDTARIQSRAWLAPRRLELPPNFVNRIDDYTEVTLRFENTGKEPATKTNEKIGWFALDMKDWRNYPVMQNMIRNSFGGTDCDQLPLDRNGRAVFPGATPGAVAGFNKSDVAKVNQRTHYALVAGCFAYQTLRTSHLTKFCFILAARIQSEEWDSIGCGIFSDAD